MADLDLARLVCLIGLSVCRDGDPEHQANYYQALAASDERADALPFIAFMLDTLHAAICEAKITDQATDQVALLIKVIGAGELSSSDLMQALGLAHRPTFREFRENYLNPALAGNWIERTQPGSPRSLTQRYRLTAKGRQWLQRQSG